MDWNKTVVVGAQAVVVVVLGVLVALGHDSSIVDALLAVSGSLCGIGLYHTVSSVAATPSATSTTKSGT